MEELQSDPSQSDDRSLKTAESLRVLRDQADQALHSHRHWVGEIETRLHDQLQHISEELARERLEDQATLVAAADQAELLDQLRRALDEKEAELETLVTQLNTQSLESQALHAERDEELEQILELNEAEQLELESLQQQLESSQKTLQELRGQECAECARAQTDLAAISQQHDELNEQFHSLQAIHQTLQAELDEARLASDSAQAIHEQTTIALAEAEQHIAELHQFKQGIEEKEEELDQIRRKFELALADVHKFKRENAELQEELLSRPEADEQESPELVSLRAERDALAERITDLENAPAQDSHSDAQQELDDLQRRFEMAVDDVRQLKQSNADLSQQLAAAGPVTVVERGDEPAAQDWQAQKARLLASLDAEDQGDINESRREELATIEGTISITDRVVAEKDVQLAEREAEIATLQSELEARPAGHDLEELREQIAAEILGDDEAVQVECEKMQQQQRQLDAKLREAELDLSVQRATLARERSAMEEKLAQLSLADTGAEESNGSKPRRRWLSAMGIKDDDAS